MTNLLVLAGMTLFCTISVLAASFSLGWIAGDPAVSQRVRRGPLLVICVLLATGASLTDGVLVPAGPWELGLVTLVVWAAITACFDRATTWVPDICAVMMLFGALTHSPQPGWMDGLLCGSMAGDAGSACNAAAAFGWAVLLWAGALVVFRLQCALDRVVLTAADCVAVGLPMLAFGPSLMAGLSYLAASAVILLAGISGRLHRLISNAQALREGLDDLGRPELPVGQALPAFIIFAPITAVLATVQSIVHG